MLIDTDFYRMLISDSVIADLPYSYRVCFLNHSYNYHRTIIHNLYMGIQILFHFLLLSVFESTENGNYTRQQIPNPIKLTCAKVKVEVGFDMTLGQRQL